MQVVVGPHGSDDSSVIMGVMDEVSITIAKGDIVIFPLEMFYSLLVQVVDISEWHFPCFLGIAVSNPAHFSNKMGSAKDSSDLMWGLHYRTVILLSHPPIIDVILQVSMVDEFLYLIL